MIKHLIKLADHLDKKGLHKEAEYVDWIIRTSNADTVTDKDIENAKKFFFEKEMCSESDFKNCYIHKGNSKFPENLKLENLSCIMHKTTKSLMPTDKPKGFYLRGTYDPDPIGDKGIVVYLYRKSSERNLAPLR